MGGFGRVLSAPGVREAWLYYSLARGPLPVETSAPSLYLKARRLVRDLPPTDHRVLLFTTGTVWLRMSLPLAAVLAARGSCVDVVVAPYGGDSPTSPHVIDDYYRLKLLQRLRPAGDRLRLLFTIDLTREPLAPDAAQVVARMSELDAKTYVAREELDLDDPEQREMLEGRLRLNGEAVAAVDHLTATQKYDAALVPNGASLELGAVFRALGLRGIPRVAFEYTDLRERSVVTFEQTIEEMPIDGYWDSDEPHELDAARRERVAGLLAERETLDWQSSIQTYQLAAAAPGDEIRERLGLRRGARLALLCPNLLWEAYYLSGVHREGVAFDRMWEWLVESVKLFEVRPDWELVIRAHPWESKRPSVPGVEHRLRATFPELPANVHVVAPTDPVNTYSLMTIADLGLVYLSTTGLEMALRGLPVVAAGHPHYSGRGFTIDPGSPEDYRYTVRRLLEDPRTLGPSDRQRDLAWCYADVVVFAFPQPFPWVAHHFDEDVRRWPPARCVSPEGDARFGRTFDLMRAIGWSERRLPVAA